MLSAEAFILGHLAIVVCGLLVFVVMDRRSRDVYHRWHRKVRYQRLSTTAMLKRLARSTRIQNDGL